MRRGRVNLQNPVIQLLKAVMQKLNGGAQYNKPRRGVYERLGICGRQNEIFRPYWSSRPGCTCVACPKLLVPPTDVTTLFVGEHGVVGSLQSKPLAEKPLLKLVPLKFAWLKMLNASTLNLIRKRSLMNQFFANWKSKFRLCGPKQAPRAAVSVGIVPMV